MAGWLEPVEMEVGPLAWGSWPETFIFLAVSGEEGVGGWQAAVWRVVPAKCGQVSCRRRGAGAAELDWPPLTVPTTLSALATLAR